MENSRINHYAQNEAARQIKPRKRCITDKSSKGYKDGERPDLSEREFDIAKNIELDRLNSNQLIRHVILKKTYGQKHNLEWLEARKKLINCTYFGRIVNSRRPTSYKNLLYEMLYSESEFGNTAQLRHQRLYELEALKMFSLLHDDYTLEKTGLYIDKELSFLGILIN